MRKSFEMSDADLEVILAAAKQVPLIVLQAGSPPTIQENINFAWRELGNKLGFRFMTAKPNGQGPKCFSAEELDERGQDPLPIPGSAEILGR